MTDKTDSKEREDVELSRACVKAWDSSGFTSNPMDAVHPMFSAAFELGYRASLAASELPEGVSRDDTVHGETYFTAADMATASAQGFRDWVASLAASAGSEPVAWVDERVISWLANSRSLSATISTTLEKGESFERPMPLYTHPSPPEGMVGGLQVYRCKIKSRKQIDREIPREQQGWWADVAAGQKLLLRQAVQSDLDRCTLGGKRSRNPADYMCETHTGGSLVSKVALEYMNPEENVFAAPPTSSADSSKEQP